MVSFCDGLMTYVCVCVRRQLFL